MYLHLFHGRRQQNKKMNDWGLNGPMIGPLESFHDTYRCHPRIFFCRFLDQKKFFPEASDGDNVCDVIDLEVVDDLIKYNGIFYGDYEIVIARDHG
jgi:hypothetical protein